MQHVKTDNRVNGSLLGFNYQLSYYYYYCYYCCCCYCYYCYYYLFYFLIIFINLRDGVGTKTPVEWNSCLDCKSVIPLSFHRNQSSTVSFVRSPCNTERLSMSGTIVCDNSAWCMTVDRCITASMHSHLLLGVAQWGSCIEGLG